MIEESPRRRPRVSLLSLLLLTAFAAALAANYGAKQSHELHKREYQSQYVDLSAELWERNLQLGWGVDSDSPIHITVNPIVSQPRIATDTSRWAWRFTTPVSVDVRLAISGTNEVVRRYRIDREAYWHSVALESYFGRKGPDDDEPRRWYLALVIDEEIVFLSSAHADVAARLHRNPAPLVYPDRAFSLPPINVFEWHPGPVGGLPPKLAGLSLSIEPLPDPSSPR